jgi:hypothetical protein
MMGIDKVTEDFLDHVAASRAVGSRQVDVDKIQEALQVLGEVTAEVYALLLEHQRVGDTEPDQVVVGALGEYEQRLGALERVGREVRELFKVYRTILRETADLHTRLGVPLRETGEVPRVLIPGRGGPGAINGGE